MKLFRFIIGAILVGISYASDSHLISSKEKFDLKKLPVLSLSQKIEKNYVFQNKDYVQCILQHCLCGGAIYLNLDDYSSRHTNTAYGRLASSHSEVARLRPFFCEICFLRFSDQQKFNMHRASKSAQPLHAALKEHLKELNFRRDKKLIEAQFPDLFILAEAAQKVR